MNARQYRYTVEDVASASGVSVTKVRRDSREGRVNLEILASVCRYVLANLMMEEAGK